MAEALDYADMSLDDVIKDMKARKAAQEEVPEDNSPFLRENHQPKIQDRRFKPNFSRKRPYLNYATNFSRRRIQQAKRTLDLRNRIIHLRATRQGLDLRWKLVANMIAKLRQQEELFNPAKRHHPYGIPGSHGHCGGDGMNGFAQPKISRASLNQIEKLVGKLPSWMRPKNVSQPTASQQPKVFQQYYPPGPGPIRSRPHAPVHSPGICSSYATCHPVPTHISCPNLHHGCPTPHTHCQMAAPVVFEPPPLVFEPPPPSHRASHQVHATYNPMEQVDISIVVPNEQADLAPVRRSLHERFSL